ncbi:maestro heat-like repeat-containing protein family member 7 [Crotalus adamanteus]|uniref:Maestro heat-like repeat-containing protein family member 7 n=1 Tax=Crotalus adamanteus TaxID=8729 RepID=A0AAW1BLE7_CROAD
MDLCSFLEDDDDLLKRMVPFRWEDSDLSLNSLELGQEDSQEDIPGDNGGPLLRCLKRIYRKTKKEKTRRRKALSSGLVPDLSAMATIWEETDDPQSAQGPELLLASWRSSMEYFHSKKEEMVKEELPEPNIICLQAMNTVTDFSKKHIMKTMGSYKKGLLLRTFFKSVFSLSPVKAGQEEEGVESSTVQYTKNLFIGTYQAFSEMLQQLMVENPIPSELERILQLMVPWLQAPEADLRERAIWSSASLLNFVANKLQLETKSKFSHLGHLVAILGICCGDPIKSICSKAAKSIHLLLSIVLGQKIAKLDQKNVHTEVIKWKHQEFLETWNPMVFLKNPSRVAEVNGMDEGPRWEGEGEGEGRGGKERGRKERKGEERRGGKERKEKEEKEQNGEERKGKERKGRKGTEQRGEEKKGEERKGRKETERRGKERGGEGRKGEERKERKGMEKRGEERKEKERKKEWNREERRRKERKGEERRKGKERKEKEEKEQNGEERKGKERKGKRNGTERRGEERRGEERRGGEERKGKERKGRKGTERRGEEGKERTREGRRRKEGKERNGEERKGKERGGEEMRGKKRNGEERKGKEKKGKESRG